jgi:hypothetical protein
VYPKGIVRADKDASSDVTRLTVSILDGTTCAGCGGSRWIGGKGVWSNLSEVLFGLEPEASGRWVSSRASEGDLGMSSVSGGICKDAGGCELAGLDARVNSGDSSM